MAKAGAARRPWVGGWEAGVLPPDLQEGGARSVAGAWPGAEGPGDTRCDALATAGDFVMRHSQALRPTVRPASRNSLPKARGRASARTPRCCPGAWQPGYHEGVHRGGRPCAGPGHRQARTLPPLCPPRSRPLSYALPACLPRRHPLVTTGTGSEASPPIPASLSCFGAASALSVGFLLLLFIF